MISNPNLPVPLPKQIMDMLGLTQSPTCEDIRHVAEEKLLIPAMFCSLYLEEIRGLCGCRETPAPSAAPTPMPAVDEFVPEYLVNAGTDDAGLYKANKEKTVDLPDLAVVGNEPYDEEFFQSYRCEWNRSRLFCVCDESALYILTPILCIYSQRRERKDEVHLWQP